VSVRSSLLVQHHTQERSIDLQPAVVFDETELPELVHEKIDPRTRRTHHLRQRFLRHLGENSVRLVFSAVAGKQ